ncbi:MAG TPA: hypothetical protein VKA60_23480 [Blastocatellia bacterium]|nr:hypothetical protein [Blastocatellia bacterium]
MTFNLCDNDELDLTFTNRKGVVLFSIWFLRAFFSARHRKAGKEDERTVQTLHFNHYSRGQRVERVSMNLEFRTKAAPRTPEAKTHKQTIKLTRPIKVSIIGAGGVDLGRFEWERSREQTTVNALNSDGALYGLILFPPDPECMN